MIQDQVFNSLTFLDKYAEDLTIQGYFIAGVCYALTGEPVDKIIRYLTYVQAKYDTDKLSEDQKRSIEYEIFQGRLNSARDLITQFRQVSLNPTQSQSQPITQSQPKQEIPQAPISNPSKSIKSPQEASALEAATLHLLSILKQEEQQLYQNIRQQEEDRLRESLRVAKEIEEQFERELQDRLRSEQVSVRCEICSDTINTEDLSALDSCTHIYHKDCISSFIENEVYSSVYPIVCPSKTCSKELSASDIRELISSDLYAKYMDLSFHMQNADIEGLSCCPTPGCKYQFEWAGEHCKFSCPICNIDYCMDCRCQYHAEMTCQEFRNAYFSQNPRMRNKVYEEFVIGMRFKECPKCAEWNEKNDRNNNIDCRCGYKFCYSCGNARTRCECGKSNGRRK